MTFLGLGKERPESLAVSEDSFDVLAGTQRVWGARFREIARIEAYKRDELTTDLICFDIYLRGDPEMVRWVHEDLPGWADLIRRLERLSGFDSQWHAKVAHPPFAESRAVVYVNDGDQIAGGSHA